jgi:hypothetical protein
VLVAQSPRNTTLVELAGTRYGISTLVAVGVQCVCVAAGLLRELKEMRYWRRRYLRRRVNLLDLSMHLCLLASIGLFAARREVESETMFGVTTLLFYSKILWYLQGFRQTGPLIRMILQIAQDIFYLIALLAVIILGATFAYYPLTDEAFLSYDGEDTSETGGPRNQVNRFFGLMLYLYEALLLGTFEYNDLDDTHSPVVAKIIFVMLTLFVLIILLNLLIALMSDSFERIKEREEQEYCFQTAKILVDIEVRRLAHRLDEQEKRAKFPSYVHVLIPDKGQDLQQTEWLGIAGQIRKDMSRLHEQARAVTTHELGELAKRVETLVGADENGVGNGGVVEDRLSVLEGSLLLKQGTIETQLAHQQVVFQTQLGEQQAQLEKLIRVLHASSHGATTTDAAAEEVGSDVLFDDPNGNQIRFSFRTEGPFLRYENGGAPKEVTVLRYTPPRKVQDQDGEGGDVPRRHLQRIARLASKAAVAHNIPVVSKPEVSYDDANGHEIRFALEAGRLFRHGSGGTRDDVTEIRFTAPRKVLTQDNVGGNVPERHLQAIAVLATAAGVPHNIPAN